MISAPRSVFRRPFGCLVVAGLVVGCVFGLGRMVVWRTGVVFPGVQFFYGRNNTRPETFRLTVENASTVVRVRIAPDYVESLILGARWRYAFVNLTAYLPDMVPERSYDARDPRVAKSYATIPREQLLQRLEIGLSQSGSTPSDPIGAIGFVQGHIDYDKKNDLPLGIPNAEDIMRKPLYRRIK